MTTWNYANTSVETTLSSTINSVDTSMTVASVVGWPVSFPYTAVIDFGSSNLEVVNVTSAAGTTLTITRGQDGTSADGHASGAVVVHALVARDAAEPQAHIAATAGVHGLSGGVAVVGTTSTQTLTNKTLTTPTITGPVMSGGLVNLNNQTILTIQDGSNFSIQAAGDSSKKIQFNLSGITTATTRTLTIPDATTTMVGTGVAQTLSNKTLDNSSTVTVKDTLFTIQDDGDATKQVKFQASGVTTATTRTLTVPDASTTLVGTDATQTLTNKSLTSPTITGTGTAAVASLTVNSVDYTPAGAAWTTWVPTLTNLTLGNGTQTARYRQMGKTIDYYWSFVLGSTSAVSVTTPPKFTLPVAPRSHYGTGGSTAFPGAVHLLDAGLAHRQGLVQLDTGSTVQLAYWDATPTLQSIGSTTPWTWGTNDAITAWGSYEAA